MKKYRHQFAKDPNIDVTKVRAASLTSDAEAAIICPVRHTHTHMHACTYSQILGGLHGFSDVGRLICWNVSEWSKRNAKHVSTCCRCSHAVYSSRYVVIARLLKDCAQRQAAHTFAKV